ncbi:MAG: hypothetical protein LBS37_11025 [Treponema sp.]|jgi:hypothetical protein|nr:hypothetical protein [Treponema sp.]
MFSAFFTDMTPSGASKPIVPEIIILFNKNGIKNEGFFRRYSEAGMTPAMAASAAAVTSCLDNAAKTARIPLYIEGFLCYPEKSQKNHKRNRLPGFCGLPSATPP